MAKVTASVMLDEMSGKAGSVVYVKTKRGIVVRPRRAPSNPNTPAQEAVRNNLRKAAVAYKGLTPAQVAAWQAFAETQVVHDHITGEAVHPTAIAAFIKLGSKFLQVTPTGTIPVTPPATSFYGDSVTVDASYTTGKVSFTTSGPNSANTKTEILLQKLPSQNRHPQKGNYRSKAFNAFTAGQIFDVTVTPGYYAAAYRFVNTLTGQATEMQPINVGQVSLALESGNTQSKKKAA